MKGGQERGARGHEFRLKFAGGALGSDRGPFAIVCGPTLPPF